ncbi:hypothetical protein GCM10010112_33880 [Actinoplanes lobatus]|uniref:Uncharacterized protein n=1 Tax=Actinoplanes lobatus TaxID=113568 RepID=A0ABQ4AMB5_9ACTN|nr:hypothetical protein GCM10010112_33880 [Actinoplanes lobatus]GIE42159.1 hypothetical protein Alo02nite_50570 [Actinoplanes lobatus]
MGLWSATYLGVGLWSATFRDGGVVGGFGRCGVAGGGFDGCGVVGDGFDGYGVVGDGFDRPGVVAGGHDRFAYVVGAPERWATTGEGLEWRAVPFTRRAGPFIEAGELISGFVRGRAVGGDGASMLARCAELLGGVFRSARVVGLFVQLKHLIYGSSSRAVRGWSPK